MLRFVGEQFATATFSPAIGQSLAGIVIGFCLLLLSAANTAIVAMIGLLYMMSRDREMPRQFRQLNRHGVPMWPLVIAVAIAHRRAAFCRELRRACRSICDWRSRRDHGESRLLHIQSEAVDFTWYDHVLFGITFVILAFVELTLAHTKVDALSICVAILIGGLALRAYTLKTPGPHHSDRHTRSRPDGHA